MQSGKRLRLICQPHEASRSHPALGRKGMLPRSRRCEPFDLSESRERKMRSYSSASRNQRNNSSNDLRPARYLPSVKANDLRRNVQGTVALIDQYGTPIFCAHLRLCPDHVSSSSNVLIAQSAKNCVQAPYSICQELLGEVLISGGHYQVLMAEQQSNCLEVRTPHSEL